MSKNAGICTVHGCANNAFARTLCRQHYGRYYRTGQYELIAPPEKKEGVLKREDELKEAREIYKIAIGLQVRLEWARKIKELERAQ